MILQGSYRCFFYLLQVQNKVVTLTQSQWIWSFCSRRIYEDKVLWNSAQPWNPSLILYLSTATVLRNEQVQTHIWAFISSIEGICYKNRIRARRDWHVPKGGIGGIDERAWSVRWIQIRFIRPLSMETFCHVLYETINIWFCRLMIPPYLLKNRDAPI